ncbi:MAG: hypothetical protein HYS40_08270 [Gemmatimonadetes bacterium]|nr:hypothetical protein [Gemmatimonadota bacterium]
MLALGVACSDAGGVDADVIAGPEKAAVQGALNSTLASDSSYLLLAALVFPFVDRASRQVGPGGDTTRVVAIQLDIDAAADSARLVAQLSAILAWSGYDSLANTVDTVVFVVGEGANTLPINDSLRTRFSPDTVGTGTGFAIHQTGPSTYIAWLARAGALQITAASYGSGVSQSLGTLDFTRFRGTGHGAYHMTAKLIPDSSTTIMTALDFSGGVQALKMRITGTLP